MKFFFKFLILFIILVDVFYIGIFSLLVFMTVYTNEYEQLYVILSLFFVSALFFIILEVFLLRYYGNIVISVSFKNDDCIIKTNTKEYVLPSENFYRVEECIWQGRTFIFYDDGNLKRKFTFQMKYFPFHSYHLNINEMKNHMTNALFE